MTQHRDEHGRYKKDRNWIGTILIAVALLIMIIFLLQRCDIRHMKWKPKTLTPVETVYPTPIGGGFTPSPENPIIGGTPKETPFEQPHHADEDLAKQDPTISKDGVIVDDGTIDSRQTDPHELDNDPDLTKGDEGVESKLGIQPLSAMTKLYPSHQITGTYPVNDVISFGSKYFGRAYQYGSNRNTDSSFDCSDFTHWIWWKGAGMDIPRDSRSQAKYVQSFGTRKITDIHQAQRGDLLFFMNYRGWQKANYNGINRSTQTISHVGIYLGNGKMMHTASRASGGVRIDSVFDKHYEWRFIRGGSVL